jgi:MFS family permease
MDRARGTLGTVGAPLAVLASIAFIAQIGIAVMLPLLPLYAVQLGASPFVLGLLTSAFAVTNGLSQLSAGLFLDRWGSRRFISGGLGLYAAANALIATATNALFLVVWRAVSGIGGGVLIIAERVYVAEVTPQPRRAFANGILSAAASAGMVAGPAVGGVVVGHGYKADRIAEDLLHRRHLLELRHRIGEADAVQLSGLLVYARRLGSADVAVNIYDRSLKWPKSPRFGGIVEAEAVGRIDRS